MGYPKIGLYTAQSSGRCAITASSFSEKYAYFRQLLVRKRREKELTQTQLAEKLKRPQSFVSKYESGERRLDLIEFLEIARSLRADPHSIIDELERETDA